MKTTVSIVIPAFNERENLLRCLASLKAQTYPADRVETLVVDDASTDGTAAAVRQEFPNVRLLVRAVNSGPDDARQEGVQAATGDLVAFTDSDCVAPPDWLENLVRSVHEHSGAVVGGRILHRGPFLARVIGVSDFGEFQDHREKPVHTIPTCNMGIRREILLRHGFEGRLRMVGDTFLSHSLSQHGERLLFDPAITIFHFPGGAWDSFVRRARRYGEGFVQTRTAVPTLPYAGWVRAGLPGILCIALGRTALDWYRLTRFRRTAGIPVYALPAAALLVLVKRLIGLAGAWGACRVRTTSCESCTSPTITNS